MINFPTSFNYKMCLDNLLPQNENLQNVSTLMTPNLNKYLIFSRQKFAKIDEKVGKLM